MKTRYGFAAVIFTIIALWGVPRLRAQENSVSTSPGVARVSLINGEVSMQRGDSGNWVASTLNTPLEVGDRVSTGTDSRAEVELDYANVIRLSGQTDVKVANLSKSELQVQVAQGLVDYWVTKENQANLEIDTPNVAVHPLEPGTYRVEVDSASKCQIIVRKGKAQVSTPQGSADLNQGQMMVVEGVENPQYQIEDAPGNDSWDGWNKQRDDIIANARSWQYDNSYYTGTEDLDAYGNWQYVPGYDWCWTPYIDEGWTPYSDGQWVWEPYYGWTWVSSEPWGWAPYHYGRWFVYGSSWAWWPGPVTPFYQPIWAPAYVSFFGFGAGFGVGFGFGFGHIGWLAIGPGDPYYPWWGGGHFGYRGFNIANMRNINNFNGRYPYMRPLAGAGRPAYSNLRSAAYNARVRAGMVSVAANRFGTGAIARGGYQRGMSLSELHQASFVAGHVPAVPTRASLSPSAREASRSTIPSAAVNNRRFFSVRQPAAAPRSFAQQSANLRQALRNNGNGGNARGFSSARSNTAGTANRSFGNANEQRTSQSFSRNPGNERNQAPSEGNQARPGWRSFGNANGRSNTAGRPGGNGQQSFSRNPNNGGNQARPGFRSSGSSPNEKGARPAQGNRPAQSQSGRSVSHPESRGKSSSSGRTSHHGWQSFSSSARFGGSGPAFGSSGASGRSSFGQDSSRSFSSSSNGSRSGQGWDRFSPQARQTFNSGYSRGGQKPPLQLDGPIVSGRSRGSYGGSWGNGYFHRSAAPRNNGGFNNRGFQGGGNRASARSSGNSGGKSRGGYRAPSHSGGFGGARGGGGGGRSSGGRGRR